MGSKQIWILGSRDLPIGAKVINSVFEAGGKYGTFSREPLTLTTPKLAAVEEGRAGVNEDLQICAAKHCSS